MQDRALSNPKIIPLWNSEILEATGDEKMTGLAASDAEHYIAASGLATYAALDTQPLDEAAFA